MSDEESVSRVGLMVLLLFVLPLMMFALCGFLVFTGVEYALFGVISVVGLVGVIATILGFVALAIVVDYLNKNIQDT